LELIGLWRVARLSDIKARQLPARDGKGGSLGKRGARVNTISPGIIITPLANYELRGPAAQAIGA